MIFNYYRRLRRLRPYQRRGLYALVVLLAIDSFHLVATRPKTTRAAVEAHHDAHHAPSHNVTVYIASVHRNTEEMLSAAWNEAVVALADHLGPQNVHFAAVESGSQDNTKEALMDLKASLDRRGVSNTISLGMTVDEQLAELDAAPDPAGARVPGWIWDQDEQHYALRRIPYLARVRNQVMEPLAALARQGRRFDKVLWVNDVVFDVGLLSLVPVLPCLLPLAAPFASCCLVCFLLPRLRCLPAWLNSTRLTELGCPCPSRRPTS